MKTTRTKAPSGKYSITLTEGAWIQSWYTVSKEANQWVLWAGHHICSEPEGVPIGRFNTLKDCEQKAIELEKNP